MTCASRPGPDALAAALSQLASRFGERLAEGPSEAVRRQHGNQLSEVPNEPPDAVCFPQTTDEVADAVRICAEHRVPDHPVRRRAVVRGPCQCAVRRRLDRSLAHEADRCRPRRGSRLRRRAGRDAQASSMQHLRDTGLFFPIDPGADASLGGMAATRASGTNAVRYGTMRDNVLGAHDRAAGRRASSGPAPRARNPPPATTSRACSSAPRARSASSPKSRSSCMAFPRRSAAASVRFPTVEAACNAAIATIQSGIPVARIELIDEVQVRACNAYSQARAAGDADCSSSSSTARQPACANSRSVSAKSPPSSAADRSIGRLKPRIASRLWQARHDAYWAARALRPGAKRICDRCLRADLAACRLRRRDKSGHRRERPPRADRRPCRRRQFPRAAF